LQQNKMSKLFYDHIILLDEIFVELDTIDLIEAERETAKQMIDELVQHRVLTFVLDLLPAQKHESFLIAFHAMPYDPANLQLLNKLAERDVTAELVVFGETLKKELKQEIRKHKKKKVTRKKKS